MKVKVDGAPPKNPLTRLLKQTFRVRVRFLVTVAKEEKTPDTAVGKSTTGKKRGMGAALRGSRFTSC